MRIGIFGGSFDPVHTGHLILAEYVKEGAGLDRLVLMPAYVSPFKIGKSNASSEDRLEMAYLATHENPHIEVDPYEVQKATPSYTADTMAELKRNRWPDDSLYFVAGTDSILEVEKWKDADTLLRTFGFVVGTRPGYRDEELDEHIKYLRDTYGTDVIKVNIPKVDISSTSIRRRSKEGKSIKYLVPRQVEEYIISHGLYK
jgi:nicotinate-nucleotide adenylyltransferase